MKERLLYYLNPIFPVMEYYDESKLMDQYLFQEIFDYSVSSGHICHLVVVYSCFDGKNVNLARLICKGIKVKSWKGEYHLLSRNFFFINNACIVLWMFKFRFHIGFVNPSVKVNWSLLREENFLPPMHSKFWSVVLLLL